MSIKVFEPSQIIISFSEEFEYVIDKNKSSFITYMHTWFFATKVIMDNLPNPDADDSEKNKEIEHRFTKLIKVVKGIRQHNHGGILLFVKDNNSWRESIQEVIPYAPTVKFPILSTRLDYKKIDLSEQLKLELQKIEIAKLNSKLNLLGQLTAVDGATIITFDFDILAFGAKIKPLDTKKNPQTIFLNEPFYSIREKEISFSSLGGTRHQSVAQFVFDQKDVFAVVVSQDGKISIIFWDEVEKGVRVIQHTEYWFNSF